MKINPWVECPNCHKIHSMSGTGTLTFQCNCGQRIGDVEIERMPLDTMPEWAQEVVYREAFGLLEDDNATWEWFKGNDSYVLIRAHGFKYIAGRRGMCR